MKKKLSRQKIGLILVKEYLGASNSSEFERQLTDAIVKNHCPILFLSLKGVESLDSRKLMALVSAKKLATLLQRRLIICSVSPTIQIIFELSQLDRVFEISEEPEFV
jgi:anti-sigma B factor antagonist